MCNESPLEGDVDVDKEVVGKNDWEGEADGSSVSQKVFIDARASSSSVKIANRSKRLGFMVVMRMVVFFLESIRVCSTLTCWFRVDCIVPSTAHSKINSTKNERYYQVKPLNRYTRSDSNRLSQNRL